ncbi:polyphosphate polymerase domain-containing protein [Clostridiaceae bacterium M8S5]|nr:polyphosphate polymerase domain-containing protein [Clostridiaceae bacterium M8S5]
MINEHRHTKTYRNEIKFYIEMNEYKKLSEIFKSILNLDKNANENGEYWIRSLYFDSLYNSDYYDKMMGTENRKKIRLRIYDVNCQNVKLEIKNKYNSYMLKESVTISKSDATELTKGNKEVLLKYNNQIANKVYYYMSKDFYRPKVLVDYKREAYISEVQNVRITFDKDIRSTISDFDIFSNKINSIPIFEHKTMVMEVKFNRFLPSIIKSVLSNIKSDKSAISKYCMSRNIL